MTIFRWSTLDTH